jgi:hypothetical protein
LGGNKKFARCFGNGTTYYKTNASHEWRNNSDVGIFSIDTSGNITIGSATFSSSAITVRGNNNYGGTGCHGFLSVTNTYGSATTPSKHFRLSSSGAFEIINNAYNSVIFGLNDAGDLSVTGGMSAYSDERLKTNWRNLPDDFVERLSGLKYGIYDRTDIESTQVGVSAQSLELLLPNAVVEINGLKAVSYGNAAMVSVIELSKTVVELRSKVAELERLVK